MATKKKDPIDQTSSTDLVNALVQAIQLTKPIEKKNPMNRKPGSPWDPKDGSKKLKMKRKMYQHGLPIDADFLSNDEIELLNKVKIGRFYNGLIKIFKRKDSGIDIDWPVRTASQRVKIASLAGNRGLCAILESCIAEANSPKAETFEED